MYKWSTEYKLDNGEYSTSIPKASEAKTYTVYYRITGDKNHNNVDEQSLEVIISPLMVNIVNVTIDDAHLNENGYELNASNVTFDVELTNNDYEVSSITLTGNNEIGAQNVEVVINITNTNYQLVFSTITSIVNITDHEPNVDDDNCTTAVTCKYCDYVFVEATLAHESQEDDNDPTTEVRCKHCNHVVKAAIFDQADGLSIGAIIGIVIGSVAALASIAFSVFWFIIKKRNFADLLILFKK